MYRPCESSIFDQVAATLLGSETSEVLPIQSFKRAGEVSFRSLDAKYP
jgi:hypothetical protein